MVRRILRGSHVFRHEKSIHGAIHEKGVTFIELIMAAVLIGTVIVALLRVMGVVQKGGVSMRNEVRAGALGRSKLDDLKDLARQASLNGTFALLTQTSLVQSYGVTQTTVVSGKSYVWKASSAFASQSVSVVADVGSNTVTTSLIHFVSWVEWKDGGTARDLTLEAFVADTNP